MKALRALALWSLRAKLLMMGGLSASAVAGALLAPPQRFLLVVGIGIGFSAIGGYWLGPRWFLVPLVAMAVEIAIAVPPTLLNGNGGETPVSVVLEAPFWTGLPSLIAAVFGGLIRLLVAERHRRSERIRA